MTTKGRSLLSSCACVAVAVAAAAGLSAEVARADVCRVSCNLEKNACLQTARAVFLTAKEQCREIHFGCPQACTPPGGGNDDGPSPDAGCLERCSTDLAVCARTAGGAARDCVRNCVKGPGRLACLADCAQTAETAGGGCRENFESCIGGCGAPATTTTTLANDGGSETTTTTTTGDPGTTTTTSAPTECGGTPPQCSGGCPSGEACLPVGGSCTCTAVAP